MRLVQEPRESAEVAVGLASSAQVAVGADAVLVAGAGTGAAEPVLGSSGLSSEEEQQVLGALADRPPGAAEIEVPGFARALVAESAIAGAGGAVLCALQRRRRGFECPRLARVFARHGVIAAAATRHGPRLVAPTVAGPNDPQLVEAADYDELNHAVTRLLRRLVAAERTGLFLWSEQDEELRPVPGALGSDPAEELPAHAPDDWTSSVARVFVTGYSYLSNRAHEDAGVRADYADRFAMRRLLTVPIVVSGRRIGVLQMINKPRDFSIRDLRTAEEIASALAFPLQAIELRRHLRRARELERIFTSTAIEIACGRDVQEYLSSTLESLCEAMGGSAIALVPASAEPIVRHCGAPSPALEQELLAQARGTERLCTYRVPPRRAGEAGWAAAHAPIVLDGAPAAVLSVLRSGGSRFDADDCDVLARMAQLVALAWAGEFYQRGLADAARLAERQRIADELHDQVAQLLFAARLGLELAGEAPGVPVAAGAAIGRVRELLVRADAATRTLMAENAQLDDASFAERLMSVVGEVEGEFGRAVTLEITPAARVAAECLSRGGRQLITRAAREALVNASKHAGPCQLSVRLAITRRGRLLLTVTDAGVGRGTRRPDGYGTSALRRAVRGQGGSLRVNASSTGGTRVAVSLPI